MHHFTVKAYGTYQSDAQLEPMNILRRELLDDDVEIDIHYCGVCHSDIHTARNDWKSSKYPVVPGHEIIGKITRVGRHVQQFQAGDWVGVGCIVDSCRNCSSCAENLEQYCQQGMTGTYNSYDPHIPEQRTYGGYSETIVVDKNYVLCVPQNLDPAAVAPILCAGITTWSPLRHWKVQEGSKVAVVGLGGLGHMAIKLAKGLGAEVTLFSRSKNKRQDADELGIDHFVLSTDKDQMKKVFNHFDLIIDTVPYHHDLNPYLATLHHSGTLVLVGYLGPLEEGLHTAPLVVGRKSVSGSMIGGIKETQELLDFCGEKNIVSEIELIHMQEINEAYERMIQSDVKYRFVIDMQSLKSNA